MSKRQKGRRHRRVNRTPRPVGAARPRVMPVRPAVTVTRQPLEQETGLGRHAARTWESLRTCGAAGASLEELCASAGYQPRTVTKHVQGLADQGLAELRADRWYAREPAGALAAR
ncbi:hypothetical protein [Streptomyces klenkii]